MKWVVDFVSILFILVGFTLMLQVKHQAISQLLPEHARQDDSRDCPPLCVQV